MSARAPRAPLAGALAVALLVASPTRAQEEGGEPAPEAKEGEGEEAQPKPAPRPDQPSWKGGRYEVERAQGSAKELEERFAKLLAALAAEREGTAEAPAPGEGGADEGLGTPPARPKPAAGEAPAAALEQLRALAPDAAAVADAFRPVAHDRVAPKLLAAAEKLFAGKTEEIAARLGIRPEHRVVKVHAATTEELLGMELGTVAAREFASGLRRVADGLKPGYTWYVVVLRPEAPKPEEPLDPTDWDLPAPRDPKGVTRLQLFFHHEGRYVLLGRLWRME